MSILDAINQDTEVNPVAPSNDTLDDIANLAERQLRVLGRGEKGYLKQGPSGSMISDLLSWGKKQAVQPPARGVISDWDTRPSDLSIAELVALLIDKYCEYRLLSESLLPLAMAAAGMKSFQLVDGTGIKVEDDIAVGGTWKADEGVPHEALEFLASIGCADVVKDEIKVNFGRGETELASQIMVLAAELGVPAVEKLSIHAGTLKSLVKEQREKGVEFPKEWFNIFPFQKTIIQPVK